jgi:SOS response associated peptidase (SRAP)
VIGREGARALASMRWGLVPSWWSKPLKEMKLATFNARVETVAEKPIFRGAFQRTRCLIPASGYYEWNDASDGKQPYYFTLRDGTPITIAGLWDDAIGTKRRTAARVKGVFGTILRDASLERSNPVGSFIIISHGVTIRCFRMRSTLHPTHQRSILRTRCGHVRAVSAPKLPVFC